MATFLLWNVQRKPLDGLIVRLVQQHKVHVLILVERPDNDETLLRALQEIGHFNKVPSKERFGIYAKYKPSSFVRLAPPVDNSRMDFWRFQPTRTSTEVLLGVVHGLDRFNHADERRALFFERVAKNMLWAEGQAGHHRSLVVGDFNANPFEASVGSISGLHAIPVREVGGRSYRTVLGCDYPFFVNPMWSCYGGMRQPPATYYWNGSDVHELFWHMLDQVVLRPDALPLFPEHRLSILHQAGPIDLLTPAGLPDKVKASDHLPILFELNLRGSGQR